MKRNEIAKAYAEALPLNAISIEEIVAWADSIILEEDEPCIEIIELAFCSKGSDAITYLNLLSVGADEEASIRFLFSLCYKALKDGLTDYSAVAKRLFFWSMYETELDGFNELGSFWDDLDLANEGIVGEPEVVKKEILDFLSENKA
ncbi:MAG: hypothetical protein COA78_17325 [Blastopirellula sp.]|nr:MAG: hypothetical protein COA78_17325 [Blastopirellula sp.]